LSGALTIAFSAILYRLAEVSPSTGAFFRCLYALPVLYLLARWEDRRFGPRPFDMRRTAWIAGAFFAADLILWHHSIEAVGAGLATVVGNTQVVLVGLIAWAVLSERPPAGALAAVPLATIGIVLISGVLEQGAYGENPPLGALFGILTGIAYSAFLLVLRHGSRDLRRVAGPLYDATLATTVLVVPAGLALGELDFTPPLAALGWLLLLALSAQVLGWLLITVSLPRLPAVLTSVLLTFQPLASVVLAALLLAEDPSGLQLLGAAAILAGLVVASVGRRRARTPKPVPDVVARESGVGSKL
jgi:drug/metabolite transporter (DMT)-like permease